MKRQWLAVVATLGLGIIPLSCVSPDPSIPAQGFVDVEGGRIWYQKMGSADGIPLLVIHGVPGGGSCGYL